MLYFLDHFSLQRVLYVLTILSATYPLFRLHLNQRKSPHQPIETAWFRSIVSVLASAFDSKNEHPNFPPEEDGLGPRLSQRVCHDLEQIYHLLGVDSDQPTDLFPAPHTILCTTRLHCIICPQDSPPPLSRHGDAQEVKLLKSDFRWVDAKLFVAYCVKCKAEYYPDRVTYRLPNSTYGRVQRLEYDSSYLRVSKGGIWMHRRIALAQEHAVLKFRSGWSNFAEWLSDTIGALPRVTTRQSQRLYFEHFSRRLIVSHGLEATFTVAAHSSSQVLAESVRDLVGRDGGVVAGAMDHGCTNCTHLKRYTTDLIAEGAVLDGDETGGVVDGGDNSNAINGVDPPLDSNQIPPGLGQLPTQQTRPAGTGRGYSRMAVMDGKRITHRLCSLSTCNRPLVNFKNGRFCREHLDMRNRCGIIPCGRPVYTEGASTCDNPLHKDWHGKYLNRFSRLSFPGVQRVIRRQNQSSEAGQLEGPALHSELPDLDGTLGAQVVHTFRARTIYCLQTVQWSCEYPIGWGKCYNSESSPQVLAIIDKIWEFHPDSKPSFIAYDDACNLLRHIVTQDPHSTWLKSTKFVVDAWHYIGHRALDLLCRVWCNPAPTNGSQPDLIIVRVDDNGQQHATRAFNTETAEQLNAWLNGYEAQLRQMSDTSYDFCVHVLMLLYKELVDKKVAKKEQFLSEEFWEKVQSLD
ncbi:hypothetical protein DFH09DRAFT_1082689 [Mycena vulgaris]|nr:hypothetical protein DFH09DRAFT_1109701 [Mycena vulgaris]KAJ6562730.1 hypothetical protein DFH09DRAFT_1082689 [Mycena vulgaris]